VLELRTERLKLRALTPQDAGSISRLANDREIAANTLNLPHPYTASDAEAWIGAQAASAALGEARVWAVTLLEGGTLVGAVGLHFNREHGRAELGYWVGRAYWSKGICTEAVRAAVGWAFEAQGVRKVHAQHFGTNPASGRVLQKLGFRHEGTLRAHYVRMGVTQDALQYGLLASEWRAQATPSR
jgi:[ribosomal protein S5]-alanine N-acetyltransferase